MVLYQLQHNIFRTIEKLKTILDKLVLYFKYAAKTSKAEKDSTD